MMSNRALAMALAMFLLFQPPFVLAWNSQERSIISGTLAVAPSQPGSENSSRLKVFTVVVSRFGFNGSSDSTNLQVNQGDRVRMLFVYGDNDMMHSNGHDITIEGYNIVTDTINKKNPTTVVEFTAGQAGKFVFYCSKPCVGMENLQSGTLEVKPAKAAETVKTSIVIKHLEIHHSKILLHVISTLADDKGRPVEGVLVHFFVSTTFGMMKIGSNTTQADGNAHLTHPLASVWEMAVGVHFDGNGIYQASDATASFLPDGSVSEVAATPPYVSGQNKFVDLRLIGIEPLQGAIMAIVVALIVGSVWSTYTYVLRQILKVRPVLSRREREADR